MIEKSKIRHFHSNFKDKVEEFPYANTTIFILVELFIHIYPFYKMKSENINSIILILIIVFLLILNDYFIYKKAFMTNYVYEIVVNLENKNIELNYFCKKKPLQKVSLNLTEIKVIEKNSFGVLPNTSTWTAFRIIDTNDKKEYIVSIEHWNNSVYNVLLSFLKSELKML